MSLTEQLAERAEAREREKLAKLKQAQDDFRELLESSQPDAELVEEVCSALEVPTQKFADAWEHKRMMLLHQREGAKAAEALGAALAYERQAEHKAAESKSVYERDYAEWSRARQESEVQKGSQSGHARNGSDHAAEYRAIVRKVCGTI